MEFASDNESGASQQILDTLLAANAGASAGYGNDDWTQRAITAIQERFEHDAQVYFVATGTAANSLALASMVTPWQTIVCHADAHIANDESTAPEFMSGGARMVPLAGAGGKLQPRELNEFCHRDLLVPHNATPKALSLTQSNETGRVYSLREISDLCAIAKHHDLSVHMDGARFANALVALGCTPAQMSWQVGVDVLCLGATKCGGLSAEAVVFFNAELARDFEHRRKRTGHLLSKGRLFGAQFVGWFENEHWLSLANHANAMAKLLAERFESLAGVRRAWDTQANELFFILPKALCEQLLTAGAHFYEWPPAALGSEQVLAEHETLIRLVTSHETTTDMIDALIQAAT